MPTLIREVTLSTPLMSSEYSSYGLCAPPPPTPDFEPCSILMNSQDGSSEAFIGEWAEQRGIRDRLFIATKVFKWVSTILISV